MPPVIEVYNRVVQCQLNQRCDRRGKRRRHLSDQTIKTETAEHNDAVQVGLEIGHRSILRSRPTPEGFTHDWVIYVRGAEGSNIQHFVDKIIFHLHESFPKSTRVVKDPPYQVAETGYGGFTMPIDVYIKNNGEPKKIRFQYELFLGTVGTITHNRCEKLTFQQPSAQFRERLVKGGAIAPESTVSVPREGDESSSTGDSTDSRNLDTNGPTRTSVVSRPASAPLPELSDQRDVDKYVCRNTDDFCSRPTTSSKVVSAARQHDSQLAVLGERPLSYLQRRLHCRVALTSALPPGRDHVPTPPAAAAERTTADSDDVIVVGSGWTSASKRGAKTVQPKLEPGIVPVSIRTTTSNQLTAVTENPRQRVWNDRRCDISESSSHVVCPTAPAAVVQPSSGGCLPPRQLLLQQNVKRGRGRPRKYPRQATFSQQLDKSTTSLTVSTGLPPTGKAAGIHPRSTDVMNRFIHDKENISPRPVAVGASKRLFQELDRNIWTSNTVRDVSKSVSNKSIGSYQPRQRLSELPVNVLLSDENNNFGKKPVDKVTPGFRLKDLDKEKLMSVWNALKGTLQPDDWDAITSRNQTSCHTAEQRRVSSETTDGKCPEKRESRLIGHQKLNEVVQVPVIESELPSRTHSQSEQAVSKTVHWKCPEVDDVKQIPSSVTDMACVDDLVAGDSLKTNSCLLVDDVDEQFALHQSLGKPLSTSTPIKLTDTPASTVTAPVLAKRARVRFRPVTQRPNDDEDDGDRVELSKLAALPSMRHGAGSAATGSSGVRPADVVRAFRTIDHVATASGSLPTPTLTLPSHGVVPALTFMPPQMSSEKAIICRQSIAPEKKPVSEDRSPGTATTSSSDDVSPTCEIVPGAMLHFYGARCDDPPYNVSPSTGGFVTKAARKRPMSDEFSAPDRKRFEPDVPPSTSTPAIPLVDVPQQPRTFTVPPQPEVSRPAANSQCRRAPEVTSHGAGIRDVRRAPNGVPVDDLLRLQRHLSTLRDATTLRRVVQIIGETGRYCVNDVTFDFDLCNLDSATVTRLIRCLDATTA